MITGERSLCGTRATCTWSSDARPSTPSPATCTGSSDARPSTPSPAKRLSLRPSATRVCSLLWWSVAGRPLWSVCTQPCRDTWSTGGAVILPTRGSSGNKHFCQSCLILIFVTNNKFWWPSFTIRWFEWRVFDSRAPDKVCKINFNRAFLCYYFTKSYVYPLLLWVFLVCFACYFLLYICGHPHHLCWLATTCHTWFRPSQNPCRGTWHICNFP